MKKYEDENIEQRNQNIELKSVNENLRLIIKEKEIQIDKMMNGTQDKEGQLEVFKDQIKEKDLVIEAMLTKMDLFKKNIDELNFKYLDSQKLLDQMKSQDFAKQNLILKREATELTDAYALK